MLEDGERREHARRQKSQLAARNVNSPLACKARIEPTSATTRRGTPRDPADLPPRRVNRSNTVHLELILGRLDIRQARQHKDTIGRYIKMPSAQS